MLLSRMGAAVGALLIAAHAALTPVAARAQVSTDIVRGRVTDTDQKPVQGAEVKATSYMGQVSKTATTDKGGRFTIIFINGEGDYWIDVRKLGLQPKRFEVKKVGDEEVMLADARLSSAIVSLDAVDIRAQRTRALPDRSSKEPDVGGGARPLTNNPVSPDQEGNLAAMAAAAGFQLVPGLNGAPDMYSVLGLSGDQNNVTFNGLGSGISALPPDVLATTSINPYPFDVSRGGFSGAQISILTIPGSNFSRRVVTNSSLAPQLEWADQPSVAQGDRYTSVRVGGNAAGPFKVDEIFYNGAYNVGRRLKDVSSLVDANEAGLIAAGVAPDSAARLLNVLRADGISVNRGGIPGRQAQDVAQGLFNMDLMPSASGAGHSFTLGLAGDFRRTSPVDVVSPLLATPGHADATTFWGANASLVHTNYFWFGVLSKTTIGLAGQSTTSDPYQRLPEGIVSVASALPPPDGGSSVRSLSFGGNALTTATGNRTVQITNQLSWFSLDNTHTLRLTSSLGHDTFKSDVGRDLLGTFRFNSLSDVAAGVPASFTRTLTSATQSGGQVVGALALGDYWRPKPGLQVQYGVRVDGARFTDVPAANPAVQTTFGIPNDRLPSDAYFSPRVGVQWAYGTSSQVAYAPGAARPPQAVIHAGVGVFQNVAPSPFVAGAMNATGLRSSSQSITCVGSAVPFPAWASFLGDPSSVPTRCAPDGSAGTVYATGAPNVVLFDPAFREPRALRGAADWSGPVFDNRFVLGVQAIVSNGLDQASGLDLNLHRSPEFSLPGEGNRPVFAEAAAIVPSTGSIAAGAGRVSADFARVWMQRSDLAVHSRQVKVDLKPITANLRFKWDLTYTFLGVREQYRGFSSTAGDPFAVSWGTQPQTPRHTIDLRWTDLPIFNFLFLTTVLHATSGERFTPLVASDVNGDGMVNDRAFIFDPTKSSDSLASAMRTLLATGAPAARACLSKQIGQLASRASCQAPWTIANAVQLKFNPAKVGLPKRATIALTVANPLGILDLALHGGADTRGWGQQIPPDDNLLYVRGYDPTTRAFKYDVNQRFGSTRPRESVTHTLPFVSLQVSVDVGVPRERQLLTQRLEVGRTREGSRATPESMKNFATSVIPNPMAMVLTQQEELKLTRAQADSLATLSYRFSLFADSVWTPVSDYFVTLPEVYSHGEAYSRYVSARERTIDYLMTLVPAANGVLTGTQRRQLPLQIANYLDLRVLRYLRSSSAP
ncbi:MAG TPA: carboxypeptidase-like regulatory domain-containing protein [Gemmatimonadaceae bacterium]|nr:carboxypeptidase-like regulatory domain-containing protein [Gemmatimonadaceae bacterium]